MKTKSVIDFKYVFFAIAISFGSVPVYMIAPQLYNLKFDLPFADIAIALLIAKFFDILQTPYLGYLLDKFYYSAAQKIKLFSFLFLPASLVFYLLLFPPTIFKNMMAYLFTIILILNFVIINLLAINYYALIKHFHQSTHDKLTVFREIFFFIGISVSLILSANFDVRIVVFIIYSIVLIIGTFFISKIKNTINLPKTEKSICWSEIMNFMGEYKFFLIFHFMNIFAFACTSSLVLIFINKYLGLADHSSIFLLIYTTAIFIGFYACYKFIKKINKHIVYTGFALLNIVFFSQTYFIMPGSLQYFSVICCFAGFFQAADFALPVNIFNSLVPKNKNAASYYSIWFLVMKIALAAGSIFSFSAAAYLAKINFIETNFLLVSYVVIPCVVKFIALIFFIIFHCKK